MLGRKVRSLETIIVDLPLRRLQRFVALGATTQSIVLVRLRTDDGIEGVGEAVTPSGPWWGGESVESIKLMIDTYIAPIVVGSDIFELSATLSRLDRQLYGNSFAKAGVEMAMLDAWAKAHDRPLCDLFGGPRRRSLPCAWPLATGDVAQEIEEAERMLDARLYRAFKLKMGALPIDEDIARACTIARALESRAELRIDPNEAWQELTAKRALPRLEEAGITMIEQPFARENLDASARLTARAYCAVMIDEGVRTAQDMLRVVQMHAADLVSLKLMKSGGMIASRKVADIAVAGGVSVYMGTFLECTIGTSANMHFASTLESLPLGGELCGAYLVTEDIAEEPAVYKDFELHLPNGPGIGARIDESKLRAFRRDRDYSVHIAASPARARRRPEA